MNMHKNVTNLTFLWIHIDCQNNVSIRKLVLIIVAVHSPFLSLPLHILSFIYRQSLVRRAIFFYFNRFSSVTQTHGQAANHIIFFCEFIYFLFQPEYYRDARQFRRVGEGPEYRLLIPHAKLDHTGAYSVIARNCHGEAKAVISLQIYTKGQSTIQYTMFILL